MCVSWLSHASINTTFFFPKPQTQYACKPVPLSIPLWGSLILTPSAHKHLKSICFDKLRNNPFNSQKDFHLIGLKSIPTQWYLLTPLGNKPFENTVGKGEIARNEQFLLFPQCFLSFWITFCHFCQIWNCRLQTLSVWKSLKFVVWERVKLKKWV